MSEQRTPSGRNMLTLSLPADVPQDTLRAALNTLAQEAGIAPRPRSPHGAGGADGLLIALANIQRHYPEQYQAIVAAVRAVMTANPQARMEILEQAGPLTPPRRSSRRRVE